jgi:hypothetical protein
MSHLLGRLSVASGLALLATVADAAPLAITECHQEIAGTSGILTTDLDCSADPLSVGVDVLRGDLYLDGHSITGAAIGVACVERCTIYGPGTIVGNGMGVDQFSTSPSGGKVRLIGVTVTGNDSGGIGGDRVKVEGSTVSGNGGLILSGNAIGGGVIGKKVLVRDSSVSGNLDFGVFSGKIALRNSSVATNGTDGGCVHEYGSYAGACGDLVSSKRPSVSPTSQCDVSVSPPAGTWGVCSAD